MVTNIQSFSTGLVSTSSGMSHASGPLPCRLLLCLPFSTVQEGYNGLSDLPAKRHGKNNSRAALLGFHCVIIGSTYYTRPNLTKETLQIQC